MFIKRLKKTDWQEFVDIILADKKNSSSVYKYNHDVSRAHSWIVSDHFISFSFNEEGFTFTDYSAHLNGDDFITPIWTEFLTQKFGKEYIESCKNPVLKKFSIKDYVSEVDLIL